MGEDLKGGCWSPRAGEGAVGWHRNGGWKSWKVGGEATEP